MKVMKGEMEDAGVKEAIFLVWCIAGNG